MRPKDDPDQLKERMRRDWDARADQDHRRYILWSLSDDWHGQARAMTEHMLAKVPERSLSGHVVEIGCGVGRVTEVLAERAREVTAIDVSPRMLEMARQNLSGARNVEFVLGDGTTFEGIEDGRVDVVFSAFTLQHLPRSALVLGYLAEAGRVLVPGGWMVVQVNNEGRARFLSRWLAHRGMWLLNVTGRRHRLAHGPTWTGSRVDLRAVRRTLTAAGMRVLAVEGGGSLHCSITAVRQGE